MAARDLGMARLTLRRLGANILESSGHRRSTAPSFLQSARPFPSFGRLLIIFRPQPFPARHLVSRTSRLYPGDREVPPTTRSPA